MSYFEDSDSEKNKKYESDEEDNEKESDYDENEEFVEEDESVDDEFDLDENIQSIAETKEKKIVIDEPMEEIDEDEDFDVSSDEEETYLKKFDKQVNRNYIAENHPECIMHNSSEIDALACITRDSTNAVVDPHHKTLPILTKYERTRIIGQRAKQINMGAKSFVKVPDNVIDGYLIAELELAQKRIPFIIRRPIFGGGCEYWNLKDLEIIGF